MHAQIKQYRLLNVRALHNYVCTGSRNIKFYFNLQNICYSKMSVQAQFL